MIRRAVLQDIPALMDIYNEAILHTTATFDTEVKDMENRKAWFAEHNGRYVIYVDVEDGKGTKMVLLLSIGQYPR